jgi:L-cysteine/cystine lyase
METSNPYTYRQLSKQTYKYMRYTISIECISAHQEESALSTLAQSQRVRQAMPATTSCIYLNAGTFGPIPNCVVEAMQERMQEEWREGRLGAKGYARIEEIYAQARSRVAHLLNVDASEIALTDNTGEGMNIISYGVDWRSGDEVITTNHEHISGLAPLYQLRDRFGINIRIADLGPRAERSAIVAIEPLITPRTRLIAVSHVTWSTGAILDVQAIARMAHEHNIPVLIDGAQSVGNITIDVNDLEVDFYAIPMQKWLCGPDGTGALYVSKASLSVVAPTYVGYYSVSHEDNAVWTLHPSAQRFESGGRQTAAIAGQAAALTWLETVVGYEWLHARITTLNRYAYNALKDIPDLNILTPQPGTNGILSLTIAGHDDSEVVQRLQTGHNIFTRNIPGSHALRISTGFYNTEEEIDTLAEALAALLK